MRIAIVGMGVAGSYLAARLQDSHRVVGFERFSREKFDSVCAWGTSRGGIDRFVKECSLNFDDYILFEGRRMMVDVGSDVVEIGLKGLCTFDKRRLIRAMAENAETRFEKQVGSLPEQDDYDLVVDATSLSRALLPRIARDVLIPCVQYKAKYQDPPYDDFYIKPFEGLTGYFWYFPLGDGYAHIGAGDYYKRHNEALSRFLRRHPCEIIKKVGRPIRITPPNRCEPFYQGKVVGVGESIGSVYPLLGEGIVPSLQCARLLLENLEDLPGYRREVLRNFGVYARVFDFIGARIRGRFSLTRQLPNLLSIFFHMRGNETRYGMQVKLSHMLKVTRA